MGALGRGGGGDVGALPSPCRWLAAPPSPKPRTQLGKEASLPPVEEWARPHWRGRGRGTGGAAGRAVTSAQVQGPLRAPQLEREQPASGLPEKCPHRTLTPGASSPEARSRPPRPQCPASPGLRGSGGWARWVRRTARDELTPGRAAPAPRRPPARPAAAPFILKAPLQRSPRAPSPPRALAGPGLEPRAGAVSTCSASEPEAIGPPPHAPVLAPGGQTSAGQRGPSITPPPQTAFQTPGSQRASSWPRDRIWPGWPLNPTLPEPRGQKAARQRHLLPAPAKGGSQFAGGVAPAPARPTCPGFGGLGLRRP